VEISRQQRWFLLAMMSLAVLAASSLLLLTNFSSSPGRLLGKAYSEHRTLELRIGRTPHSPMRVQRGQENSRMDRPQSLLEAEAAIARGLRKSPEDSSLLTARGQANLLEWSYEAAITDMQEALDTQPKSPLVQSGLATAYFERAEAEDRFEDYGNAFELQSRALQQSPDDPVILFNRAITAARLYLYKQCIEDWHRYLALDPSGDWSEEARQHLVEVQEIVDAHDKRTKSPLLTPTEFVHAVDASDPKTWDAVEPRIEEYLSVAITDWLPAAFPVDDKGAASADARNALRILAQILERNHGDKWLGDMLSFTSAHHFTQATAALSGAVGLDQRTQNYLMGRKEAGRAAELFSSDGNQAGALRSEFEEVYALHFSDLLPDCLRRSSVLSSSASKRSYLWIQVNAQLEQSSCSDDDFLQAARASERAQKLANQAHFGSSSLRALGFMAAGESERGQTAKSWKECQKGLGGYWTSSIRPMPGHNLYVFLGEMAEEQEQWHLQTALGSQALDILPRDESLITLAVEHTRVARAAILSGSSKEAQSHFELAERLLRSVPQTAITQNYRLGIEIDLARVLGENGQTQQVLDRLKQFPEQLASISNQIFLSDYYLALGNAQGAAGDMRAAENTISTAVYLAERQRSSLRSEMDRAAWATQSEYSYSRLVEAKLANQDPEGALAVLEMYQGAGVRRALPIVQPSDEAAPLQRAIGEQQSLLSQTLPFLRNRMVIVYDIVPSGVMLWGYDERGMTERFVAKDPNYVRLLAKRFGELCSTPSSSLVSVNKTARQLYDILIAPLEDRLLPRQTLVFEVGGALRNVAFQALVDHNGKFVVNDHPVAYSPGLDYLSRTLKDQTDFTSGVSALVVASSGAFGEEGLRPLGDAVAEARNVARHFANVRLLTDANVSLPIVKRELSHAAVFHFSGHAIAGTERSGLVLGSDIEQKVSVLDAFSVLDAAPTQLRMAVLSACSTEEGSTRNVLDQGSLARAFLQAGAQHVIATRWNVDSASSATIVGLFYDQLFSGRSVSEALAAAESHLQLISPHPYYWAGFDAFGN
jgi:CHAT domain-containing protein